MAAKVYLPGSSETNRNGRPATLTFAGDRNAMPAKEPPLVVAERSGPRRLGVMLRVALVIGTT
jgi:hypothetical protein